MFNALHFIIEAITAIDAYKEKAKKSNKTLPIMSFCFNMLPTYDILIMYSQSLQ